MRLFTTEQVSKYHPDKYADQISDAILTECLRQDKDSHCGIETMVKDNTVVLGGEITTNAVIDYDAIVKRVANKLGYQVDNIINLIGEQSNEINNAVVSDELIGAGDQGIMFGYATNENDLYLPRGLYIADKIIEAIEGDVENNPKTILKGDAKTQVTIDLDTGNVEGILVSACHKEGISLDKVREYLRRIIGEVTLKHFNNISLKNLKFVLLNPAGTWTIGGPTADCGLTGRKIVCDQYGGYCAVGGGAFSGKDPSKVDRSASYMARIIAIELIKKFSLDECSVELAYAIGCAMPISVAVHSGMSKELDTALANYVQENWDLSPRAIINHLGLYDVNYEKLAEGHHIAKINNLV